MIDVYGMQSPNVMKIHIALEEMGLPYKPIWTDVLRGENHTPEFTALNPNRRVPVIVDHDGPEGKPFTLFESGAILLYLVDKTGKLAPKGKEGYFRTVQWVFHQHGGLGPMGGQLAHFVRFAPPGLDPYSEQRYRSENNRLYDLYDSELAKRPYLAGDDFTIADIAVWPWVTYYERHRLDLDRRKHFRAWYDKIGARPAVKRVMDWLASIKKETPETMTADDNDRFFYRGKYARS